MLRRNLTGPGDHHVVDAGLTGIGSRRADAPEDLDPGFLTLVIRIVRSIRETRGRVHDERVAAFIESNGSQMSDDLERRIGSGMLTGQF